MAHDLLRKICQVLDLTSKETDSLLSSNFPFESFIETLHEEVSIEGILDVFDVGHPNTNHILFAKMMGRGILNSVCTTNFDLLLENALINEGYSEGVDFEKYYAEGHFKNFNWDSQETKLIKLHGCVSDRKQIGITLNIVASTECSFYRNQLVRDFFSKGCNDVVIVIGYSCSDIFDISPQIESLVDERCDVIFVDHQRDLIEYFTEPLNSSTEKNPFKNFSGFRIKIDADYFAKVLWDSVLDEGHQTVKSKVNWQQIVDGWLASSIKENSVGIKSHLPARLFYNICDYSRSLRYCEQGKEIAQQLGDFWSFYSEMGNAGMALNAMGRFEEAKEYLMNSIIGCRMVSNTHGIIAQSEVLGHIHRNLHDYDSALRWFGEALQAAEQLGESFSICTSIGNLCSVYNYIGHTEESIRLVNRGIGIARQIGNKQSEGAMLNHLGIAYFQLRQPEKSRGLLLSSLELTRSIGDVRSEALVLINLGNIEMNERNSLKAKEYLNQALLLANQWDLQEGKYKAKILLEMLIRSNGGLSL